MALPTVPAAAGIFAPPTLRSALDRLSSHIQKQSPSSSHHPEKLATLHEALLRIVERLPFDAQGSTQLKDIAYAADDLVDELEYKSLQQQVEEFNRSNPYQPITGPSISQFRGFQTGENDARNQAISDGFRNDGSKGVVNQESNGDSKSISVGFLSNDQTAKKVDEFTRSNPNQLIGESSISQSKGPHGQNEAGNQAISDGFRDDGSKGVVNQESNGDSKPISVGFFSNDQTAIKASNGSSLSKFSCSSMNQSDGKSSLSRTANHTSGDHGVNKPKGGSVYKSLRSAISNYFKCFGGKDGVKQITATSISVPIPELGGSLLSKQSDGDHHSFNKKDMDQESDPLPTKVDIDGVNKITMTSISVSIPEDGSSSLSKQSDGNHHSFNKKDMDLECVPLHTKVDIDGVNEISMTSISVTIPEVGGSSLSKQSDDHRNSFNKKDMDQEGDPLPTKVDIPGINKITATVISVPIPEEGGSSLSKQSDCNHHSFNRKGMDHECVPLPSKVDIAMPQDISYEDAIEERIDKMIKQLDCFAARMEDAINYKDQDRDFKGRTEVLSNPVIKGEVYGRDGEREQLVKMLLKSSEENISVIPIFGMAGVGKTTLAQYVYNDERVERHFHAREWICASDSFDMMRIAGELEESLYLSGPLDQLQLLDLFERNLKAELKGKRFLLMLDDVRSVEWTSRLAAIDTGEKGSKILLTAREEEVVDEVGKRNKIVLKGLEGEGYWSLFKRCAFGDEDPDKHLKLQSIGKEIAEMLKGSPLAAKIMGGALRDNLDDGYWTKISRSEYWVLGKFPGDTMPALRLSYQQLPPHHQRCFAYCSVFPKGHAFDVDKLVHIWIAQGLIPSANMKRVEDMGAEYFFHLFSRSFFELPTYTKSYWRSKYYLMHDLLHDLAESVCFDECFMYGGQELGKIPKSVCHLSVSCRASLNFEFEWKSLRTLIINSMHVTEFEVLKRVRVLDLSHSYMRQLPDAFGHLVHLRYLNLSGNNIYSLPESLCRLYHLQSLIVPHRCRRLPKEMANLINLHHLAASDEAISWIAWIGRLTCLQELKVFHVRKVRGHDVGQLKGMRELRGQLCIQCLDDIGSKEEAIEANLKDKSHLRKLQLKWMRWNRNRRPDVHEDVLECLEPPQCLEELEIHWYRGLQSPSWLKEQSIRNLKFIYLRGCEKWNQLPPLGQLPFLEVLKIEGMDAVVDGGGEMVEIFPSLKELWLEDTSLYFEGMPVVLEPGRKFFPHLCKLSIRNCNRMKGLPPLSMFSALEELDMRKCPDLEADLISRLKDLTSLSTLKISELHLISFPGEVLRWLKHLEINSCENLTSWLADEKEEGSLSSLASLRISNTLLPTGPVLMKYLTSLQELRIDRCSKLKSFTAEQQKWFKELMSLRELSITDCKSLRSLPTNLHCIPSLEKLTIASCPMIRSLPTDLPAKLKRLEISNCNPGLAVQWQGEGAPESVKRIPYRYIV